MEASRESSDGYRFVRYDPVHKPGIARLQRHLWSPDEALNLAYFSWKHEANPYVSAPQVYLALFHDEPVAMRAHMGSCWEAGELQKPQLLFSLGDLVVAPEHRRRGLTTRLRHAALPELAGSGMPYLVTLSAWITRESMLRAGWRTPGPLLALRRPRRGERGKDWEPFRSLDAQFLDSGPSPEGLSVTASPRGRAMADLVRRLDSDGRIRHVRDETYFAWRFGNPRRAYRFVHLGGERLEAYLVLQTRLGGGIDRVRILDWEGETAAARRALLLGALERIGDSVEIVVSAFRDSDRAALQAAGFIEQRDRTVKDAETVPMVYRVDRSDPPWLLGGLDLLELSNWDHRSLYSDGH